MREGSTRIHQDATVHAARLSPAAEIGYTLGRGRLAYPHLVRGALSLNGLAMSDGDGAKIAAEPALQLVASAESEVILFDLPH